MGSRVAPAVICLLLFVPAAASGGQDGGKDWGTCARPAETETVRVEKVACPICESGAERVECEEVAEYEWDTDFMVLRASFDVYPYVLTTCPKCSYSTYSAQFHKPVSDEQKEALSEGLREIQREFADVWAVPLSHTVRAATLTQKILKVPEGTLFEIYLLGTYLARGAKEEAAERQLQQRAIENLVVAVAKDEMYQRPRMRYLAGELYRRLELYKEALEWFGKARQGADQDLEKLISRQEMSARDAMDQRDRKRPKK